ncbi:hypothetical protein G6F58_013279 [Rhizopus delemar]|nr:hypothetical protein G6F58_013279 [Rhizopus delemar]
MPAAHRWTRARCRPRLPPPRLRAAPSCPLRPAAPERSTRPIRPALRCATPDRDPVPGRLHATARRSPRAGHCPSASAQPDWPPTGVPYGRR